MIHLAVRPDPQKVVRDAKNTIYCRFCLFHFDVTSIAEPNFESRAVISNCPRAPPYNYATILLRLAEHLQECPIYQAMIVPFDIYDPVAD